MERCAWVGGDPLMVAYHDEEWGVPLHDDRLLFEFLVLGMAQAGLSWSTILRKRDNYRRAFDGFDPSTVAAYGERDVERLLADAGIVRNHQKISAAIVAAARVREIQDEIGSFDQYLWRFVDDAPIRNRFESLAELPARTPESERLSADLRRRGFKFAGPTICYAFMQAAGLVNDHLVDCFRHDALR